MWKFCFSVVASWELAAGSSHSPCDVGGGVTGGVTVKGSAS